MEKKNCLTCKYEPVWSEWQKNSLYSSFSSCWGDCKLRHKYKKLHNELPACVVMSFKTMLQLDYSGDPPGKNCNAWEPKQEKE